MINKVKLIGASIDACAGTKGTGDTPDMLTRGGWLKPLDLAFEKIVYYNGDRHDIPKLAHFFTDLAIATKEAILNEQLPIIIGGDHSCAIGSWSGIATGLENKTYGLIWLDAHLDAHTPEDSESGNIHGMPVATLMGEGYPEFINILTKNPKLNPKNIIFIGIRSYEASEKERIERLGIKVYYTEEVSERGFIEVFDEAWNDLSPRVDKIGLSIDLDGFDPEFAPGVGTPVHDGINFDDCIKALSKIDNTKLTGLEITECNDHFDPSGKTTKCLIDLIKTVLKLK